MATICSSNLFGTSPYESLLGYDYATPDSDLYEACDLFGQQSDYLSQSISADIEKSTTVFQYSDDDDCDYLTSQGAGVHSELKVVRNKDAMWSGSTTTTALSTSASSSVSDNGAALPLAVVTGGNKLQQQPPPTIVKSNFTKLHHQQQHQTFPLHTSIKVEPNDDYEQQLQGHSIPNSKTLLKESAALLENTLHIPPGTSLLRRSNVQQQRKQQLHNNSNKSIKIPTMCTSEFVRERDQLSKLQTAKSLNAPVAANQNKTKHSSRSNNSNVYYGRPDTPHSLDDESALMYPSGCHNADNDASSTTGFSHDVDLRACIVGSNNISLSSTDPKPLINLIDQLSQQLQDTSKDRLDLDLLGSDNQRSFDEVLDYIGHSSDASAGSSASTTTCPTDKMTKSMSHLRTSDYDSDEDDDSLNGSSCNSYLSSHLNEDSMSSKMIEAENSDSPATSPISNSSRSPQYPVSHHQRHQQIAPMHSYLHSDHSYTRSKDGMDDLNNLTPSDSDEEIDVVSIGDKKLPTNPSDKDRRAIQTKFAHKISNQRVVKNLNGLRTIPPRRRGSFELPYTPASSSPVKSVANSRYPSPASTPYHNQYTGNSSSHAPKILVNSNSNAAAAANGEKSRKRLNGILSGSSSNNMDLNVGGGGEYALPPLKKCRSKKQQQQQEQQLISAATNAFKHHYSFDEAADTIEKRNLHNDMERQRRIGLKNLFDALKKQIPSIKDKERAPKVNILREAAKLCEALTREDEQLSEQRALLRDQQRMRQELLARLRNLKQE